MLSTKMVNAINEQINAEMYSAYFYLAMNSFFESKSLAGFSHWMRMQAQEEMLHAMKLYDYVNERGGQVVLEAIAKPPAQWNSPMEVLNDVLAHEQKVTGLINNLMNIALDERDHASGGFLQWFVSEQVEEEANVGAVVDKLKLIGTDTSGLFVLDQELGKRLPPTMAP
ncbi:MAG: ferritin [Proteobacteria bacterium]|nr:ferritin [Pseudomonadota bacterium]MBU1639839.1 ferritin [Pseudomonadota bacterium]